MPIDLHHETSGSGPSLIVLHGLYGSSGNWRTVGRALAATHTVHAVDLRNHGASPWADSMDYVEMAEDVKRLIERLGLQRAAVMGHSMGGKTAMALALRHPERVSRLIVVDIAPIPYADTLTPFAEAMKGANVLAAATRAEVQRRLAAHVPEPDVVPFLMQNLVTQNDHFDWRLNLMTISAAMPGLCSFPAALTALRYGGPTVVLAGAHSHYVLPRDASAYAPMFTQVRIEVVENAGHWVHADQPEAFVHRVKQALK